MSEDSHPLDYYPEEETGDERTDSLVLIDKARAALAQAQTLSDIGAVREIAERARRYASAAKLGRAAENHAARLRLEAERKAGSILAEMDRQRPVDGRPKVSEHPTLSKPKLSDLGVSRQQASDWQRMAAVPDEDFEAHVQAVVTADKPLTTAGVVEVAKKIEKERLAAEPKPSPDLAAIPSSVRCEVGTASALPLEDDSVHLIVTSPPYGVGIDYADSGDIQAALWPNFMHRWLAEAYRVTVEGGRLALNVPLDTTKGGYRATYSEAVQAAQDAGWTYRSTIVWEDGQMGKSVARGSVDSQAAPHIYAPVEMIALFCKERWGRTPPCPPDLDHVLWLYWTNGLWRFGGETRAWEGHPAAFPLELPRRLVQLLSFPGDVVLDPFCGSGTTILAAHQLGRQAIGYDRSRVYVDSALRRIAAQGDMYARTEAIDRGRSGPAYEAGIREGLPGEGAPTGEPGGLRSRVHRGVAGTEQQELIPSGRPGLTTPAGAV